MSETGETVIGTVSPDGQSVETHTVGPGQLPDPDYHLRGWPAAPGAGPAGERLTEQQDGGEDR